MAGQIVELASCHRPLRVRPRSPKAGGHRLPDAPEPTFQFWRGASKTAYVHTVYRLIDCPDLQPAVYVFVRVAPTGRQTVLEVGRVEEAAPSLNLAHIRQRGAMLGATQVHIHLLGTSRETRRLVELDLRAGLLRSLGRRAQPRLNDKA